MALLLTLLAIPGGWYLVSPWWTLWRVRAVAREDPQRLATYVDFEGLTWKARSEYLQFWKQMLKMYSRSEFVFEAYDDIKNSGMF